MPAHDRALATDVGELPTEFGSKEIPTLSAALSARPPRKGTRHQSAAKRPTNSDDGEGSVSADSEDEEEESDEHKGETTTLVGYDWETRNKLMQLSRRMRGVQRRSAGSLCPDPFVPGPSPAATISAATRGTATEGGEEEEMETNEDRAPNRFVLFAIMAETVKEGEDILGTKIGFGKTVVLCEDPRLRKKEKESSVM